MALDAIGNEVNGAESTGVAGVDAMPTDSNQTEATRRTGPEIRVRPEYSLSDRREALAKELIQQLASKAQLTPEAMVRIAEPPASRYHNLFEWNDRKAAHEYRLSQARYLIRAFEVVFEPQAPPVRAFPSIHIGGERQFVPIAQALSDEAATKELIADALRRLKLWRRQYEALRTIAKIRPVFEAIDSAVTEAEAPLGREEQAMSP